MPKKQNPYMKKSELIFIFSSFLIWRVAILAIAFLSIKYVPVFSNNFFGGGLNNYSTNPLFWGNINFDGEHYLALAQNGYQPLTYFFFPLFPYIIRFLTSSKDILLLAETGLVISNLSFLIALLGIYKLVKLDFKDNIAKLVIILLLIFPTSFYFGAYYTESIFLALIIWSFYEARKGNFFLASVTAALASATRIVGIILFFSLFIEYFLNNRRRVFNSALSIILISPLGLIIYIYYLFRQTGDPLIFLHEVSIYGQQRSSTLILLPQVLYRYVFKILPAINYSDFANIFTTYLEFGIALLFLTLIIYSFWKLKLSYAIYALLSFLIPTLAGSFSSMPRYALAIFPVFILSAIYIEKIPKIYKYFLFSVMLILMSIATALFWRGYWIS